MASLSSSVFPPGYVFEPGDKDLGNHYLIRKMKGEIDVRFCFIKKMDIYEHESSKLSDKEKMHFFTPLHWKNKNNADRKVPSGSSEKTGFWRKTGEIKEIRGKDGTPIAEKTSLAYYEYAKYGKSEPAKTRWLMKEYKLDGNWQQRQNQ